MSYLYLTGIEEKKLRQDTGTTRAGGTGAGWKAVQQIVSGTVINKIMDAFNGKCRAVLKFQFFPHRRSPAFSGQIPKGRFHEIHRHPQDPVRVYDDFIVDVEVLIQKPLPKLLAGVGGTFFSPPPRILLKSRQMFISKVFILSFLGWAA